MDYQVDHHYCLITYTNHQSQGIKGQSAKGASNLDVFFRSLD